MKQKNRRPGDILDDTAATLRIHFGRARPLGRNSAIASMLISANGTAVSTQRLNNRFRRVGGNTDCAGSSLMSDDFEPRLRQNVRKERESIKSLYNLSILIGVFHESHPSIDL